MGAETSVPEVAVSVTPPPIVASVVSPRGRRQRCGAADEEIVGADDDDYGEEDEGPSPPPSPVLKPRKAGKKSKVSWASQPETVPLAEPSMGSNGGLNACDVVRVIVCQGIPAMAANRLNGPGAWRLRVALYATLLITGITLGYVFAPHAHGSEPCMCICMNHS